MLDHVKMHVCVCESWTPLMGMGWLLITSHQHRTYFTLELPTLSICLLLFEVLF